MLYMQHGRLNMKNKKLIIIFVLMFSIFFINNTYAIKLPSEKLHNYLLRISYEYKEYGGYDLVNHLEKDINYMVNAISDREEAKLWDRKFKTKISKIYLLIPYIITVGGKTLGYEFLQKVEESKSFKNVKEWVIKNIHQCESLRAKIKEEIRLVKDIKTLEYDISTIRVEIIELLTRQKFNKSSSKHKKLDKLCHKKVEIENRLKEIRNNRAHCNYYNAKNTDIIESYWKITAIIFI